MRGSTKRASQWIGSRTHLVYEHVDIEALGDTTGHALLSEHDEPLDDALLGIEASQTLTAGFRGTFEAALSNEAARNILPDYPRF